MAAARCGRAHRDRARPARELLGFRRDRRRDPDLHAQARRPARRGGYGTLRRCRRQRGHRHGHGCRRLQRAGRRAPRRRFFGDESVDLQRPGRSVLHLQPRRRRLPEPQPRRARRRTRSAASCCRRAIPQHGTQSFDNGALDGHLAHARAGAGVNLEGALRRTWTHRLSIGNVARGYQYAHVRERLPSTRDSLSGRTISSSITPAPDRRRRFHARARRKPRYVRLGAPYDDAQQHAASSAAGACSFGAFDSELSCATTTTASSAARPRARRARLALQRRCCAFRELWQRFRAPNSTSCSRRAMAAVRGQSDSIPSARHRRSRHRLARRRRPPLRRARFSTRVHDLISFSGGRLPGR